MTTTIIVIATAGTSITITIATIMIATTGIVTGGNSPSFEVNADFPGASK